MFDSPKNAQFHRAAEHFSCPPKCTVHIVIGQRTIFPARPNSWCAMHDAHGLRIQSTCFCKARRLNEACSETSSPSLVQRCGLGEGDALQVAKLRGARQLEANRQGEVEKAACNCIRLVEARAEGPTRFGVAALDRHWRRLWQVWQHLPSGEPSSAAMGRQPCGRQLWLD